MFTINHTFKFFSLTQDSIEKSHIFHNGPLKWIIQIQVQNGIAKLLLSAMPCDESITDWTITFLMRAIVKEFPTVETSEYVLSSTSSELEFLQTQQSIKGETCAVRLMLMVKHVEGFNCVAKSNFSTTNWDYSDIILQFKEKTFYCHSIVLALHSTVFADVLSGKQIKSVGMKLEKIDSKCFKMEFHAHKNIAEEDVLNFLNILYGKFGFQLDEKNVENILQLASSWNVQNVALTCIEFLKKYNSKNILPEKLVSLAYKHDDGFFKNQILSDEVQKNSKFIDKLWTEPSYSTMEIKKRITLCEDLILLKITND